MSGRQEMVGNRRLTATGLRYAELIGVDWELPTSIGLTRRRTKPWRNFGAIRRSAGTLVLASSKLAGARVSVTRNLRERGKRVQC
jgi:hypothetical protein